MMGLFVVSDHFVIALFGPQWIGVIPVLKIFCLLGMVQSLVSSLGWIYQSQGRTDWFFRWGVGSGCLLLGSISIGIWIGTVEAVAASYALTSGVILLYPSFAIPGKLIDMAFSEVIRAVSGNFVCATTMTGIVWAIGYILPYNWSHWVHLAVQIPVGIAVYGIRMQVAKIQAYLDLRRLLMDQGIGFQMHPMRP